MQTILNLLLDEQIQRRYDYHNFQFSDYADALEELWPKLKRHECFDGIADPDAPVSILGCGSNALAISLPEITSVLKITGDDWDEERNSHKFDARIFWRRESNKGVSIYLQQGGWGPVSEADAYKFARVLEGKGWDCWDGGDGVEIDMTRQLVYAHPEDDDLGRGVRIGRNLVILVDRKAVCQMGELDTYTSRMDHLADLERRQERNPDDCWD
ncbi:MAG: hypothetical protein K2W82_17135 [Candidatus Obscuribacterales bacterium]|nr:hypothetical protein [Candidatus Obscuribacterales bacterium]